MYIIVFMNDFCEYCELCSKIYSSNPLVVVPEECCRAGEIFLKREELKQKVRKYKEEIIHYEALINSGDKESDSYKKIIKSLQRSIDKYSACGSHDW